MKPLHSKGLVPCPAIHRPVPPVDQHHSVEWLLTALLSHQMEENRSPPFVQAHSEEKGFWRHQVHYAFPEKYYRVSDARNQLWEIAITDSHALKSIPRDTDSGAHSRPRCPQWIFYQLTRSALKAGLRGDR